jgi:two-component system cell cycle sensor histidine kinase/response regulator CckA
MSAEVSPVIDTLDEVDDSSLIKTIIDAMPDPIFCKDRHGRYILTNRAHAAMFGYEPGQIIGKNTFEIPGVCENAIAYSLDDENVIRTGEPVINREEPYERPDGTKGWFLTSKFPLTDAQGNIIGLIGIAHDVSLRREAERKLMEERKMLRTLIDAIPDFIFLKDREGRHIHINAAERRIFGVGEEYVGKTAHEWPIPREHADSYAKDDRYVFETGNPIFNREEPFLRADGTSGWLLTSKLPLRNETGEIVGLVGIARDVTDLRREREELESARKRLVDHVENSPLAIIEWLPDCCVQRWGGRAQDIFGWSPSEVEGKHFSDWPFVHPDDAAAVGAVVERLVSGELQRAVNQNRNLTKSGETIYCVWHSSVLRDAEGRIVSILSIVQNITDQIRAEEQARRADQERMAIERKLQETQKLESLGLLAGGIAHDFNNLLTSVIGNASLAALEVDSQSSTSVCLEQIQLAATRAAELCQQMLAYSGRGRFVVRQVDLNQLITETTSLIHASISKTSSLGLNLAPMLPPVLADEAQMRQIIMNLVINASEALSERSGAIRVSTGVMFVNKGWLYRAHLAPDLPEGDYVFLEVADTGCGMNPEVRNRIFDPFFTTKFTGRGLGLAAVLGIVRGHGGALRVESALDQGTTIRVVFPKGAGDFAPPPEIGTPGPRWRGSGRVLIVDDEETVRQVTTRMLSSLGFEVQLAVDGFDGVQQFESFRDSLRLVLLDLTMPRMNGEAAFREFQRIKSDVPIILMSGFNEQEVVGHFGASGLAGFLQKPFTLSIVEGKLREVLG